MAEDVVITTEEGTFVVPAGELEKYREGKGGRAAAAVETKGTVTIDPSLLRPNTELRLRIGSKPVIRTKGAIIFSAETVASSSRAE